MSPAPLADLPLWKQTFIKNVRKCIDWYKTHPRCMNGDRCVYFNGDHDNPNYCAFGICIGPDLARKFEPNGGSAPHLIPYPEIQKQLNLTGLSKAEMALATQAYRQLQTWHDHGDNFSEIGNLLGLSLADYGIPSEPPAPRS